MGAGDVKLAIGIGALTAAFGGDIWLLAALGAPVLTAGWAVVILVRRSEQTVPHGPSMCLAAVMATALAVL
jgi:leader peptidase (prepilin peptidase)/N-methyltransferase